MPLPLHKRLEHADMPRGSQSPLDAAVAGRDADILSMVAEAVRHNNTMLAYQPVVQAANPAQPAFFEGLIRVLDATGRVIPASEFMPVVENTELGREIDQRALAMGCRALADVPDLRLSINMSARSIGYRPWMRTLDRWLDRNDTIGARLILEITESSAMMVPELVIDFMDRLQARGICFAIDDFGAGHTALRYFKDFFFDMLKIDGQFISGIAADPDNQVLVQAMALIAQQFDMVTVAEFVEREEDAMVLRSLGIDCLQGFLYGAPTVRPHWYPRANMPGRKTA